MSKNKLYGYNKWYKPLKNKPEQKVERTFEGEYKLYSSQGIDIKKEDFLKQLKNYSEKKIIEEVQIEKNFLFKQFKLYNNRYYVSTYDKMQNWFAEDVFNDLNNISFEEGYYDFNKGNSSIKYNIFLELEKYEKCKYTKLYIKKTSVDCNLDEYIVILDDIIFHLLKIIVKKVDPKKLEEYEWKDYIKNLIHIEIDKIYDTFNENFKDIRNTYNLLDDIGKKDLFEENFRSVKRSNDLIDKIKSYIFNIYFISNLDFDKEVLGDYILSFLMQYQLVGKKTIMSIPLLKQTYISNDKHTTYNDAQNDGENKKRVAAMNLLVNKISQNPTYFDIEFNELFNKIYTNEFVNTFSGKNLKRDNNLFIKYKDYYSNLFNDSSLKLYEYEKKMILKYIYKFFKGRIRKMIQNPTMEYEKIFRGDIKEKCRRDITNKILEYILYEGKLEQYNIESPDTNKFQKIHAYEELYVDTMLVLWNVNYKFMPLKEDILGNKSILEGSKIKKSKQDKEGIEYETIYKLPLATIELLDNIKWINLGKQCYNESMADGLTLLYEMRSKILHGGLLFENRQFNEMKYNCGNIEEYLNNKYTEISQKHIKSLNLEENLSKNQESKILNINCNFNEQLINFFPSSSKIVNSMLDEIQIEGVTEIENSSKYNELKNVGKFLIKKIYELSLYKDNNQEGSFLKYLESNLKDNKDKKTVLDIYKEKYLRAQSLESRGKRGKVKEFQDEIINMFKKFYIEIYPEFLNFNTNYNNDNVNLKDKDILKIDKKIRIENCDTIVYAYILLGLFVGNDKINILRNRVEATIRWLEKLDINDNIEQLERIYNNLDIINDINNYEYKVVNEGKLTEEDIKQIKLYKENYLIAKYNEDIAKYKEESGKNLYNDLILFEKKWSEYFKVIDYIKVKKLPDDMKKELESINYKIEKVSDLNISKIKEAIGEKKGGIASSINKALIKQVDENLKKKEYHELSSDVLKKIKYSNYNEYIQYVLSYKDTNNFEKIYFQEDMESEIFRENVYRYTNLSDKFKESIKAVYDVEQKVKELSAKDIKIFKNSKELEEKEINVKEILTKINKLTHGREKNNKLIKYIKGDGFSKIINSEHYKSYNDFKADYDEVVEYKKIKDVIEHRVPTHLYKRLNEINWRLGQFLVLLERDMNYFIKGLKRLNILEYKECFKKTSPFIGKRYELDECSKRKYMIFVNLLGLDKVLLEYEKKEKDNIRNYIGHSYMVRDPFELSIIEIGERLDKLMEYRSLYKKAVKVSLINCIKEDVTIDYKKLNQYFEFKNIKTKYKEKKVSKLELDCNKSDYKEVLDNFLYEKN